MKISRTSAIHQHDCPNCIHLGVVIERNADLYLCPQPLHETDEVIARYSSNGPDYSAWPAGMKAHHPLLMLAQEEIRLRQL